MHDIMLWSWMEMDSWGMSSLEQHVNSSMRQIIVFGGRMLTNII